MNELINAFVVIDESHGCRVRSVAVDEVWPLITLALVFAFLVRERLAIEIVVRIPISIGFGFRSVGGPLFLFAAAFPV